jgi:hypothetical protein
MRQLSRSFSDSCKGKRVVTTTAQALEHTSAYRVEPKPSQVQVDLGTLYSVPLSLFLPVNECSFVFSFIFGLACFSLGITERKISGGGRNLP